MIAEISQYITFKLGNELFAINVAQVREVLEVSTITRVPTAPDYMRGVVNVRGKAIPVLADSICRPAYATSVGLLLWGLTHTSLLYEEEEQEEQR